VYSFPLDFRILCNGLDRHILHFSHFFVVIYPRPTPVSNHITLVLGTSWTVYFIRDVVPLMTYTRAPADPLDMLWEVIGVLSITGVLLPLITPRRHVPVDLSVSQFMHLPARFKTTHPGPNTIYPSTNSILVISAIILVPQFNSPGSFHKTSVI